jgi:hypothetical protein
MPSARSSKLIDDILNGLHDSIPVHMAMGDITQNGTDTEDATALAWLDQLPGEWHPVLGAHDVWNNARTPADWAAAYGVASKNYVLELDFARLVVVGPDNASTTLTQATIDFLDASLGGTSADCLVVAHAPLFDTVKGNPATHYSTADPNWGTKPDATVRAVLADHPNAKAWIAGHTHSSLDTEGFVHTETLGGRPFVSVNCSSPYYQNRTGENMRHTPIQSVFLTVLDDALEVRFRDHGARTWGVGPTALDRVVSVAL